ncbi:hypothetical protein DQ384_18075 [Sphaerisporangium album]|uniref:Uncharacterized protein n=1 Tax=Sphaerisporangium album TaxID=509200 RepID=A0A367FI57_9ACTN|nr:hypothetical protein DQ384_18075 [Sphaerisporangium album]
MHLHMTSGVQALRDSTAAEAGQAVQAGDAEMISCRYRRRRRRYPCHAFPICLCLLDSQMVCHRPQNK